LFALHPQKYLFKEYHQSLFSNVSVTDKVWLQNSSGLVLNWMFLFQRSDVPSRNEWSNFTNWEYDYLPLPVTLLPDTMCNGPFNNPNIGYGMHPNNCEYTMLYSTGDLHVENQKNILLQFGITFDGKVREEVRSATIYMHDQQYLTSEGFGSSMLDGLYAYHFCLDTSPFNLQPSGAINLSKFSKIEFEFSTITPPLDPTSTFMVICDPDLNQQIGVSKAVYNLYKYGFNLYVLEERYNVLSFVSGNAAMMNAR
jgi:hypothetical protein